MRADIIRGVIEGLITAAIIISVITATYWGVYGFLAPKLQQQNFQTQCAQRGWVLEGDTCFNPRYPR